MKLLNKLFPKTNNEVSPKSIKKVYKTINTRSKSITKRSKSIKNDQKRSKSITKRSKLINVIVFDRFCSFLIDFDRQARPRRAQRGAVAQRGQHIRQPSPVDAWRQRRGRASDAAVQRELGAVPRGVLDERGGTVLAVPSEALANAPHALLAVSSHDGYISFWDVHADEMAWRRPSLVAHVHAPPAVRVGEVVEAELRPLLLVVAHRNRARLVVARVEVGRGQVEVVCR